MKLLPSTGLEQLWVVNGIFNYLTYLSKLEKIIEKKQLTITLGSSEETEANQKRALVQKKFGATLTFTCDTPTFCSKELWIRHLKVMRIQ